MSLASTLKDLRQKKDMTQRDLALATGVHFTYISKIENGTNDMPPSDALLRRMALVLEVDEDALILAAHKLDMKAIQKIAKESPIIARFLRALTRGEISDDVLQKLIEDFDHDDL